MAEQDDWMTSFVRNALERKAESEAQDLRQVLLSFLEVLDSLDRLLNLDRGSASAEEEPTSWEAHLRAIHSQLLAAFERAGVRFIETVGKDFDPARHQAMETVRRNDVNDYTIVEEISRGCEWRGEVLRFSQVVVARQKELSSMETQA